MTTTALYVRGGRYQAAARRNCCKNGTQQLPMYQARCTQNILSDVALAPLTGKLSLRCSRTSSHPSFAVAAVQQPIARNSRFCVLSATLSCARSRDAAFCGVPSSFGDMNEMSPTQRKAFPCNTKNVSFGVCCPKNWSTPGGTTK